MKCNCHPKGKYHECGNPMSDLTDAQLVAKAWEENDRIGAILAAVGAIRQDLGSIKAILGASEGLVPETGSEGPSDEALRGFLEDWRKKADEKWEELLAKRRGEKGLATGDEVTPEDEADYQEGWAR